MTLAVSEGPNTTLQDLERAPAVRSWPRQGNLADDLDAVVARVLALTPGYERVWDVAAPPRDLSRVPTSAHVRRLWAFDQVQRSLGSTDPAVSKAATALAVAHRLVTPLSGAVVLETQQQYQDAGLNPGRADSVPSIPEPETWLLLLVVGALLLWLSSQRARQRA